MEHKLVRKLVIVVVVGLFASMLAACSPPGILGGKGYAVKITETKTRPWCNGRLGCQLRHDWGPGIVLEYGVANSCIERASTVGGRKDLCRVIDGYEPAPANDNRNWVIDFSTTGKALAVAGDPSSNYGNVIVLRDGLVFEGCQFRGNIYQWHCDYRQRKPLVLRISGGAYDYVLRKLWNWTKYIGNTAGCAGGIAGLTAGNAASKITLPLLSDCVDGPM